MSIDILVISERHLEQKYRGGGGGETKTKELTLLLQRTKKNRI